MTPYYDQDGITIYHGDCRAVLAELPERHYHCCVTSPPYWGLRDYKVAGGIGLEATLDEWLQAMRDVATGVWRVLRDDGVFFLNLGDSYTSGNGATWQSGVSANKGWRVQDDQARPQTPLGLKPKDLIGLPWRTAFALQADGWYLRDAIIWHKPAPMPGSQRDRCTNSYEFIFQLTKRPTYYWDMEAVKEKATSRPHVPGNLAGRDEGHLRKDLGTERVAAVWGDGGRIPRNVWSMASEGYKGAHFATFPLELPTRCIKAATSERGCCPTCGSAWVRVVAKSRTFESGSGKSGKMPAGKNGPHLQGGGETLDIRRGPVVHSRTTGWRPSCTCDQESVPCRVLDPFGGAGTTGIAAWRLRRHCTLIELSPDYAKQSEARLLRERRPGTYIDKAAEVELPLFGE